MSLKRANEFYSGSPRYYNPIWKNIQRDFVTFHNADHNAPKFHRLIYVSEREPVTGALTEAEVLDLARAETRKLLIISGPTGIGKTTFLSHILRREESPESSWPPEDLVWVDILKEIGIHETGDVEERLTRLIAASLRQQASAFGAGFGSGGWLRFFVENAKDPFGVLELLRGRLGPEEPGLDAIGHVLRALAHFERDVFEFIRLLLRFIRSRRPAARPILVLDNCDQLPIAAVSRLVQIGRFLSEGSPGASCDQLKTFIAIRPTTLMDLDRGASTALSGFVAPPRLSVVLRKRLDHFLGSRTEPILRPEDLHDLKWLNVDVEKLFRVAGRRAEEGSTRAGRSDLDGDPGRNILHALTHELLAGRTIDKTTSLPLWIHKLAGYNTRLSVLVCANFVASGHTEWPRILAELSEGRTPDAQHFTYPKLMKALLLGTTPVYGLGPRWLPNLLNDGRREHAGLLIRLRILKLAKARATSAAACDVSRLVSDLVDLFGYQVDRIFDNLTLFAGSRLISDESSDPSGDWLARKVRLTETGEIFLRRLMRDFEYLQHIAQDVFVEGTTRLVPCTSVDEPAVKRAERVLGVCEQVLESEQRDIASIRERGLGARYEEIYEDDLVSSILAATTRKVWAKLRRADDPAWPPLDRRLEALEAAVAGMSLARRPQPGRGHPASEEDEE